MKKCERSNAAMFCCPRASDGVGGMEICWSGLELGVDVVCVWWLFGRMRGLVVENSVSQKPSSVREERNSRRN